jgi:hypothetical protein
MKKKKALIVSILVSVGVGALSAMGHICRIFKLRNLLTEQIGIITVV